MNNYYAWIKNLTSIVYDNAKSESQILSELIPILLDIKDNQDTISSNMDTFYNELITKIETVQELMTNYPPTYNALKTSIQELLDNQDLVNDVINGFNAIINTINTYVTNYLNDNGRNDIIKAINTNYNTQFLDNKESDYITLVAYGNRPNTANLNDYYYDTTENKLYKYNGTLWEEDAIMINQLYLFNNKLYVGKCNVETKTINQVLSIALTDELFLYYKSPNLVVYNVNTNERNVYQPTFPDDFANLNEQPNSELNSCPAVFFNNKYYILYRPLSSVFDLKVMTTEDFINYTSYDTVFGYTAIFKILNNNLYVINNGCYLFQDDNFTFISSTYPYKYENNLYYGIRQVSGSSSFGNIITSNNANFSGYEILKPLYQRLSLVTKCNYYKYYNYELIYGNIFKDNDFQIRMQMIKSDSILTDFHRSTFYYGTYNGKFYANNYVLSVVTNSTIINWYTNKLYKVDEPSNRTYELTFNISIEEL